ncbi:uncharacterized protein LOC143886893 [Tasmannia lanceolata]|uniref:uncharacterized protein LOC143886893 n=1 Tax=Tasmannia lanceolata TaxID=3420 RepID=UPI0040633C61
MESLTDEVGESKSNIRGDFGSCFRPLLVLILVTHLALLPSGVEEDYIMPLLLAPSPNATWKSGPPLLLLSSSSKRAYSGRVFSVKAFFNPVDDPIFKEAFKEPVAFMSGVFAGFLRLDLNEDPLKEWLTRTVEASGITEEEIDKDTSNLEEDAPQQIEIE